MMGDSEFREGSLMEVLPEVAERELGNVTWIVDYNRQNLDGTRIPNKRGLQGTDAHRIERTCEANGWRVRAGPARLVPRRRSSAAPAATHLRDGAGGRLHRLPLPDAAVEATTPCRDQRQAILHRRHQAQVRRLARQAQSDDEVVRLFHDLGGHDLEVLVKALRESKEDPAVQPCLLVVHTIKGNAAWSSSAAPATTRPCPTKDEVGNALLDARARPDAGIPVRARSTSRRRPKVSS